MCGRFTNSLVRKKDETVALLVLLYVGIHISVVMCPSGRAELLHVHLNFCPFPPSTQARLRSVEGSPQDSFQTAASGICPDAEVSWA